jgi:RNA polymerase sigma-70 factor (ECF subfamily)
VAQALSEHDQKILFRRIAQGDIEAFRNLFDAYRTRLYAVALKITKSSYGAEEIVQEIFVSLWEGRPNLAKVDNPSAYIFTIAYNKSFRFLKRVAADSVLYDSLRLGVELARNETEEWLNVKETNEFIDRAIEELPPQRQLIFKLSRERGLTHKEIAHQLDISPLTVKKQMALALHYLRSILARTAPVLAFFLFYTL